jgi:hypothetical protein
MTLSPSRFIPEGSTPIPHPMGESLGIVYTYTSLNKGAPAAIAYRGRSVKSAWHFRFTSETHRETRIREFFDGISSRKNIIASRKAQATAPHSYKAGDIVVNSWGYEQTNIDFYKVKKVTANFVNLVRLKKQTTQSNSAAMQGTTIPLPDEEITEGYEARHNGRHRADAAGWVTFEHGAGYKWAGKPESCSWYA